MKTLLDVFLIFLANTFFFYFQTFKFITSNHVWKINVTIVFFLNVVCNKMHLIYKCNQNEYRMDP